MDQGTRLALRAVVQGLRRSGQIGEHGIKVVIDELRYAAQEASEMLLDYDAASIKELSLEIQATDEPRQLGTYLGHRHAAAGR